MRGASRRYCRESIKRVRGKGKRGRGVERVFLPSPFRLTFTPYPFCLLVVVRLAGFFAPLFTSRFAFLAHTLELVALFRGEQCQDFGVHSFAVGAGFGA